MNRVLYPNSGERGNRQGTLCAIEVALILRLREAPREDVTFRVSGNRCNLAFLLRSEAASSPAFYDRNAQTALSAVVVSKLRHQPGGEGHEVHATDLATLMLDLQSQGPQNFVTPEHVPKVLEALWLFPPCGPRA
jgi:hypothetical protein